MGKIKYLLATAIGLSSLIFTGCGPSSDYAEAKKEADAIISQAQDEANKDANEAIDDAEKAADDYQKSIKDSDDSNSNNHSYEDFYSDSYGDDDDNEEVETTKKKKTLSLGVRKKIKKKIDAYVDFFDEYVDFMVKYNDNPTDLSLLSDYTEMLTREQKAINELDELQHSNLNTAENMYLLDAQNKINKKLAKISSSLDE